MTLVHIVGKITSIPKRFPLLTRFVLFMLMLVGGTYWTALAFLGGEPPPPRMQVFRSGALSPASIVRDEHGVSYIQAKTDEDAYFAIGYAHAQDRLWQLELQRRLIRGEMSELFGQEAFEQDVWYRTLDLATAAKESWPALSDSARSSLQKYAEGINAGIAAQGTLPVEFKLYGIAPQRWTEFDSLARLKLYAMELSGSFQLDMMRHFARQALPAAQLDALFPGSVLGPVVEPSPPAAPDRNAATWAAQDAKQGTGFWKSRRLSTSNAWAISGKHTGGAALLANDPHTDLRIPSPWYVLHVKGGRLDVSGMTLVGLPLVFSGRNGRIAWGISNLMADTQDLYFENVNPHDSTRYEVDGRWEAFQTRIERVKVVIGSIERAQPQFQSLRVQLRSTRNGPIISDQFPGFDRPLSLRSVALEPGDTTYEALYRLQFAADWQTFQSALRAQVAPAVNVVYADVDGNIGSMAAGKVPIRKTGIGTLPVPGWQSAFGWIGYIPADQLPAEYNPPSGYVVAANNKVADARYPHHISSDWASPARARRIAQLIEEGIRTGRPLDSAAMKRIQHDPVDLDAAALASVLVKVRTSSRREDDAVKMLRTWSGAMTGDSSAAVVFRFWLQHLRKEIIGANVRTYGNKTEVGRYLHRLDEQLDMRATQGLLEDYPAEARQNLLQSSLQAALDEASRISGSTDVREWRWESMQRGVYAHEAMGRWAPFKTLFEHQATSGGSENTVDATAATFNEKEGFVRMTGASFRQVISLDRKGSIHEYMNSTGQSGDITNQHYADMIEPFSRNEYYILSSAAQLGALPTAGRREITSARVSERGNK